MKTFLNILHFVITILISVYCYFYTYSSSQLESYANAVNMEMMELKKHVFPKAYELAEKEKCVVDIKTMKCVK